MISLLFFIVSFLAIAVVVFFINKKSEDEKAANAKLAAKLAAEEKQTLINIFLKNPLVQTVGKQIAEEAKTAIENLQNNPTSERHSPRISKTIYISVFRHHISYVINKYKGIIEFDSDNIADRYRSLQSDNEMEALLHALVEILNYKLEKQKYMSFSFTDSFYKDKHNDSMVYRMEYSIDNINYDTEKQDWY